ncbi:MAG: carboxypeptidase regulatory-like domain-containing protein [Chloroflexi bacterium]|nr:carboxypeptidase regulatory-like domain-containing protein [Chloroflexota bacterium]
MSLTDSPTLKEFEDGIPEPPPSPTPRRKLFRWALAGLAVVTGLLLVAQFSRSDLAMGLAGRGGLTGVIIDENGNALAARVYVFGIDRPVDADADGSFVYSDVPAGLRSLVVAYNGTAQEYPVEVTAGRVVDVGEVRFVVATPTINP